MRAWLLSLIALFVGVFAGGDAPAQPSETRIALVIANEAYSSANLGRLPGTQRDAAAMQAALSRAGFSVTVRTNLTRAQMRAELSDFVRRLRTLGQDGVGFVYFSGHGIADGPRGQNYLVPVDAQIADVTDLPTHALPMNEELDAIELAGARATIIVIDACRNTLVSIGRSGSRGLAPVPVRTDTLVAFSTQANATAADDGLYAQALARELVQPGADAVNVFARVTSSVATATARRQVPRYDNGLIEPIVFVPQAGGAAQQPSNTEPPRTPPQVAERLPDARSTPTTTSAPVLRDSSQLRDFALFRDCAECPDMVVIPAGAFVIGSPDGEAGREASEGPQRQISVPRFALSRFEVTRGQYEAFVGATGRADGSNCLTDRDGNGSWEPDPRGAWRDPAFAQSGDHPVVCVNWSDATAYATWLGGQARAGAVMVSNEAGSYRLASEAEWEYAARAGGASAYPWGSDANAGCAYMNGGDQSFRARYPSFTMALACNDGALNTTRVGSYRANDFGLYDMIGNAWEWTQDCHAASPPTSAVAVQSGGCASRVFRGGSWGDNPRALRAAVRSRDTPALRFNNVGFRVARELR